MATAKLSVELEALTSKYVSDLNRAADKLRDFSAKATQAGTAMTAAFTVPLALLARTAITSGAELDGLNRSMVAIEGSADGASKRIKILNEIAKLPGLNFRDAVQGDVNLRSAGLSAELAAKSMSAFGNALGILGKSGALGNVNTQIQQMASKTQGFGVDLKILKEWVPQVGLALQNAFGTQSADAISQMGVTGKEVIEKLVLELEKLPKATGGIGNALENAGDAWFKFTGRIGLAIDKAIDLTAIFNKFSDTLNDVGTWFENLDPFWQKTIIGITGITAVAGPALFALGAFMPMFANIGIASKVMFSTPVLASIAAVSAGFVLAGIARDIEANGWDSFWDRLVNKAETASLKIQIALLKLLNFGGSTDFALGQKQGKLLSLLHDSQTPFNILGNSQFNRRVTPNTPRNTPPKLPTGSKEKETDYWKEYIEDERLATMAGKGFNTMMEAQRVLLAGLKNDFLKMQEPFAKLVDSGMAGQTTAFFKNIGDGMQKLSEKIKNTPIVRDLSEQRIAINEILSEGADNAITGMAEWVGAFAVGAKSFKDLGTLLKGIFGEIMIATGKQMVVVSKAFLSFKAALTAGTGIGSLGIGLGLIIAGSALKASASKGAGGGYQQVPRGSVSNYQPIYTPYTNTGSNSGARMSVEIMGSTSIRGNDIITSYNQTIYDRKRG